MIKDKFAPDFGQRLILKYQSCSEAELQHAKKCLVAAPFLTYMILSLICTNTAWTYILLALEFSIITILFAFEIFVKLLKYDTGTFEMQ